MLFDDEDVSGRRLSPSRKRRRRGKSVLNVKARLAVKQKDRMIRVGVLVMAPVALAAVVALTWWGGRTAGRLLFSRNDRFRVAQLEIVDGQIITEALIREYTGLREGMNLFEPDIGAIRRKFLRHTPVVRSMSISRHLPGTLHIEITERQPIGRLGRRRHLVVDEDGFVFGQRYQQNHIPIITGTEEQGLRPGNSLDGLALDAVRVLALCRRSGLDQDIVVVEIDTRGSFSGREDALRLYLAGHTSVDLWWDRRKPGGEENLDGLLDRLVFLRSVLKRAEREGHALRTVNLTLEDYEDNCPVTPRWD